MKKLLVVCSSLIGLLAQAASTGWIAEDGDWAVAENWDGGLPSSSVGAVVANGGTARIQEGVLNLIGIHVGEANTGTVVQTGGAVTLSGGGSFDGSGCLVIGAPPAASGESRYELRGGSLTVNTYAQVGRDATGTLHVAGGALTAKKWFSVGRWQGGVGTLVVSDGSFNQAAEGTLIGEEGIGTLVVTNRGVFSSQYPLRAGESVAEFPDAECLVRVASGGTLMASEIFSNTSIPGTGVLEFDGGTVVVAGSGATVDGFVRNIKAIRVKDGGAFFDTQANSVGVAMAFEGLGANETFVKLGAGTLTLSGANSWKGRTIVSNGTLVAASPAALPGWNEPGRVFLCLGTTLLFGADWTAEQIATAEANLEREQSSDVAYDTGRGDITVAEDLSLDAGVSKYGAGTLTLAGKNAYARPLTVWAGLLRGDFGQGLDATQPLVLSGGTYGPLASATLTGPFGTGAGEVSFRDGTASGFSAKGAPVTVSLTTGAEDEALVWGAPGMSPGALVLNGAEADADITLANPIDLNGRADAAVSVAAGTASLAGGVRDGAGGGTLSKAGAGTLAFAAPTGAFSRYIHQAGTTRFDAGSINTLASMAQDGGTVCANGGKVALDGNYALNAGALRVDGGELALPSGTLTLGSALANTNRIEVNGGTLTVAKLLMGPYLGSQLEVTLNDGRLNLGELQMWRGLSDPPLLFVQNGGTLSTDNVASSSDWKLGTESRYPARYEMHGGTAEIGRNFIVGDGEGGGSRADYLQTGGDFACSRSITVGRWTSSVGTATIRGGTFAASSASGGLIVGESGTGTLDIFAGGVVNVAGTLDIGRGPASSGEVTVHAGGVLNVARIAGGAGRKTALNLLPGSTLAALGTGPEEDFLSGVGLFNVWDRATIDTRTRDLTLKLSADGAPNARSRALTHRWSFNGDLSDSVGGVTAVMDGGAAFSPDGSRVSLPGGGYYGSGAVTLGANLLPAEGDVTIELWATQRGVQNWSRVLDIGDTIYNCLFMAWTAGGDINTDDVCIKKSNDGKDWRNNLAPYELGTEYHLALTFAKRPDGLWDVAVYKQDAATGETLKKFSFTTTGAWSPASQPQSRFYLGRSQSNNDRDAQADYNEVRIWNAALTEEELARSAAAGPDAALGGHVTKTGGGELAFTGSVGGYDFDVREGTLALGAEARLVHRWSFNGDLTDSVGGQTAVMDGAAAFSDDGRQVDLPGGAYGTGAVSLGANVLPTSGNVTLEMWATQRGVRHWSRIFDLGSSNSDAMLMTWTAGSDINTDDFCIKKSNNGTDWRDNLAPYELGTEYHLALTFAKRADGLTDIAVYKQDATTGETLKKFAFTSTADWSLAGQNQARLYLGRSNTPGDSDANASYNEVRVWNTALTEAELTALAVAGPDDTLAATCRRGESTDSDSARVTLADGATLNLAGRPLTLASLSGSGTVKGGLLTAEIHPGGAGTIGTIAVAEGAGLAGTVHLDATAGGVCDRLVFAGALDATGLTLVCEEDAVLQGAASYLVASFAPNAFTGPFAGAVLPKGWRVHVNAAAGTVRLAREGFVVILR